MVNGESTRDLSAKFRFLIDATNAGFVILDEGGLVVDANPEYVRMAGRGGLEELVGRRVTEWTAPHDRERNAAEVAKCLETGSVRNLLIDYLGLDGATVPVEISATVLPGPPARIFAVCRDVTERKREHEQFLDSQARVRSIVDSIPVGMHGYRLETDGRLVFTGANPAADRILGVDNRAFVGKTIEEAFPPLAGTEVPRRYREVVATGAVWSSEQIEYRDEAIAGAFEVHAFRTGPDSMVAAFEDITERKRAEEALRESEERFRVLVEASYDWVWEVDEQGVYTYASPRVRHILGYEPEEVVGKSPFAFMPPDEAARLADRFREIVAKRAPLISFENVNLNKDGRAVVLETSGLPIFDAAGEFKGYRGIDREITERKRAEEEARRNEARLASLYRISQHPVGDEQAFLDFALGEAISLTGSAIGYLYSYDEGKREFTLNSYSRDVMRECSIAETKTCYELDKTGLWGEAVRQRQPILLNDFESAHPLKKGYPEGHARLRKFLTVPVILQGAVVAVVGVANKPADYTKVDVLQLDLLMDSVWKMVERARAERALQESEERFRGLAESLPLAVFEIDLRGRFTYVNRAALAQFGYSQQEVEAGLTMEQVIAPADRERAGEAAARRLAGRLEGYAEYMGLRKDGTTLPITVASSPIARDGRPIGLRGIVTDLTERRQLEEERLKSQKIESIGTLAGGIAHDFNNLLQGVFGYISMAKITHGDRGKSLEMLEGAEKALHQAVGLTNQLLTFSKGGKPVKKVIALKPVLEGAVRLALSGSSVAADVAVAEDLAPVDADEGQLGQVLQNIVLNADQAMPLGGTITVTARNAAPAAGALGPWVEIVIADQGTGIPPEHLARIFDPYFTTKEKGSGLGLATSYSIVRNHGGTLAAASELGRGTTLTLRLPAAALAPAAAPPPLKEAAGAKRGRVLVMDDEEIIRELAAEMLQALGHDVALAEDGAAAVRRYGEAAAEGRPFDAVILDLTVRGGMGGAEALRELRRADPGVKAILSSGYSEDSGAAGYQDQGARGFLQKPYRFEALRDVLERALADS